MQGVGASTSNDQGSTEADRLGWYKLVYAIVEQQIRAGRCCRAPLVSFQLLTSPCTLHMRPFRSARAAGKPPALRVCTAAAVAVQVAESTVPRHYEQPWNHPKTISLAVTPAACARACAIPRHGILT